MDLSENNYLADQHKDVIPVQRRKGTAVRIGLSVISGFHNVARNESARWRLLISRGLNPNLIFFIFSNRPPSNSVPPPFYYPSAHFTTELHQMLLYTEGSIKPILQTKLNSLTLIGHCAAPNKVSPHISHPPIHGNKGNWMASKLRCLNICNDEIGGRGESNEKKIQQILRGEHVVLVFIGKTPEVKNS